MTQNLNHKQSTLEANDFDNWPIWSFTDDHDFYYPVKNFDELPYLMCDLIIKTLFCTLKGICLKGYIVGLKDVHCIGVFSQDKEFIFNPNALDFAINDYQKLIKTLPPNTFESIHDLFPLKYETQIDIPGWKNISGEFDLFNYKQPEVIW